MLCTCFVWLYFSSEQFVKFFFKSPTGVLYGDGTQRPKYSLIINQGLRSAEKVVDIPLRRFVAAVKEKQKLNGKRVAKELRRRNLKHLRY